MTSLQKQQIENLRGKGDNYAAIAEVLGISENTIKSHCRRNSGAEAGKADNSAFFRP